MYSYGSNNPLNTIDTEGNEPITLTILGVAALGLAGVFLINQGAKLLRKAMPSINQGISNAKERAKNGLTAARAEAKKYVIATASKYDDRQPRVHHIVPTGAFKNRSPAVRKEVAEMHSILEIAGIEMHTNPHNLVIVSHGYHKKLHTDAYIHQLHDKLMTTNGNATAVKLVLAQTRLLIKIGDIFSIGY